MDKLGNLNYSKAMYVKRYLQKEYPQAKVSIVNIEKQLVKVNKQLFHYQINYILDEIHVTLKKINLQSKKGKLRALNAKKILIALALATGVNVVNPNVKVSEEPILKEAHLEINQPKIDMSRSISIDNNEKTNLAEEKNNFYLNNEIIDVSNIGFKNELGMQKKELTKEYFGDLITTYANRYGIDSNLLMALFTQERSNDINDNNVGQLTRAICGEKIIAPVFQDGKKVSEDKIFVLPACYDNYPLDDLETMGNFPSFSEKDQQTIQSAIILAKNGYSIYRLKDVKSNKELNIKTAVAYLSYLINMKNNLIKGVASYNMGYTRIDKSVSQEMIMNGEVKEADDPNYLINIFEYLSEEERNNGITIFYKNGQIIHYNLEGMIYEEKAGYSL